MPPDLEPASVLARRMHSCVEPHPLTESGYDIDDERLEELIESDRASVREPLERLLQAETECARRRLEECQRLEQNIASLEIDRDEWRSQHENAVSCWHRERDHLATLLEETRADAHTAGVEATQAIGRAEAAEERIAALEAQLASARELRPAVLWFAHQMEAKLRENDHKGGWHQDSEWSPLGRVSEELSELKRAVGDGEAPATVVSEAVDVANMAMMVADHYREGGPSEDSGRSGFELLTSPPKSPWIRTADGKTHSHQKLHGVIAFLRANFFNDGAEGESVHLAADALAALLPPPAAQKEPPHAR